MADKQYLPSKQPSSPVASLRLRYMLGYFHHLVRIEVQAYHGIVSLWMLRLLFDAQAIALLIKLSHAISLRVTYTITEDGSFAILLTDTSQHQYRDRIIYHRLVKDRLVFERTFKVLQHLMLRILFRKISMFRRNAPIDPE